MRRSRTYGSWRTVFFTSYFLWPFDLSWPN